jgi:hypothetical protein
LSPLPFLTCGRVTSALRPGQAGTRRVFLPRSQCLSTHLLRRHFHGCACLWIPPNTRPARAHPKTAKAADLDLSALGRARLIESKIASTITSDSFLGIAAARETSSVRSALVIVNPFRYGDLSEPNRPTSLPPHRTPRGLERATSRGVRVTAGINNSSCSNSLFLMPGGTRQKSPQPLRTIGKREGARWRRNSGLAPRGHRLTRMAGISDRAGVVPQRSIFASLICRSFALIFASWPRSSRPV